MELINLNAGENKGHYSPGVISHGMLYISGQLSLDLDTREVASGDIKDHMRQSLINVDRVLKAAGLTKDNVVYCKVYITNINDWDKANEEYAAYFKNHKPARIVVTCEKLHFGCLCEIEAIAEVGE